MSRGAQVRERAFFKRALQWRGWSNFRFLRKHGPPLAGAVLVFFVGAFLLNGNSRLGKSLVRSSYDWSFDLFSIQRANLSTSGVAIVYMDENSGHELGQPFNNAWDRTLHARLLDRLRQEGARAVVFDILFTEQGPNQQADLALARAIRSHGSVVLAADNTPSAQVSDDSQVISLARLTPPYELFLKAATNYGLAVLHSDEDFIVREHFHGVPGDNNSSLTWTAAQVIGLPIAQNLNQRYAERWVRYYGGPETVPYISFSKALDPEGVSPGFFRGKIILVGARPMASSLVERRDELRSAYSPWVKKFIFMPAVEVHATLLLNLIRGDWLERMCPAGEWAFILAIALLCGLGLAWVRPVKATLLGLGAILAVYVSAWFLFGARNTWFPWLVPVAAQIPIALLWAILCKSVDWYVQRRRLEKERQLAQNRIRQQAELLDKAQDAILVQALDGKITYWNHSAERLYGWTHAEMLDPEHWEQLFTEKENNHPVARQTTLEKGEWSGELRQKNKAGAEVLVESRWTLVRDDEGVPSSILIINTDVTEKKKLEAQFLRTQRMESIGTLAGGIAHDLNNVLSPIMLGVELLQSKASDELSIKMLETIQTSAKRGRDMVKQVLTFARGHQGEKTVLQLSHLIKEMDKIIKETFPKNIRTKTFIEPNLWPINGDPTQLHQVLLNLCVNARDAMAEGGEIRIEARNRKLDEESAKQIAGAQPIPYIALSVSDTGTGIPPEIIGKIFEPFFTTKEIGKGTGLGLSTVVTIVKNHNGILDLQSEVGKGTTFTIYLPAEQSALPVATDAPSRSSLQGHNELILIADDEQAICDSLQMTLTSNGYRVLTAGNGAEALQVYSESKEPVSLVLMDMMMPVMGGATAIPMLRRRKSQLPILAMSGLAQTDKMQEVVRAHQLEFLTKPFSTDKLLETLQKVLQKSNVAVN